MLRGNADYSVISKVLASAVNDLYEEYGTMEKNDFKKFINEGTRGFNYLMYNSKSDDDNGFSGFLIPPEFVDFKFKLKY